ncbi:uncharacterized protein [Triticum aestivum]|uniref:uncharacterized protein isoform X2 n=2 Tax=Triticum TaxID=4564 RepID=UPI001D021983|nr:uncharacterized protein LOC123134741 isoform X2 [Triticum aestivum]
MEKLQGVGLKPWMDVFGMRIEDGEEAPNRAAGKDEVKLRAPSSYPSSACCYWKQAQYHLISSTRYDSSSHSYFAFVSFSFLILKFYDKLVIDEDYCGPMGVLLFNYSEADFTVKPRDRVIEIIVQVIATQEVPGVEDLDATVRSSSRWRTSTLCTYI